MSTIQQVPLKSGDSLYILGYDDGKITFITSKNLKQKQIETIKIVEETVYTTEYNFHISFLQEFISLNE